MGKESPNEMCERLKNDLLTNSLRKQIKTASIRSRVVLWMEKNGPVWIPITLGIAIVLAMVVR